MKTGALNSKEINVSMRIDGSFHLSDGVILEREILKHPHKQLVDFCSNIFTSGRSKRVYTKKEHGYPYLSNSDVVAQKTFDSCNYNSRKYGYDKSAFLKEGMILTGRVGAIGQTAYVTREFDEKEVMGSDNIIRIVTNPSEYSGYIYSFLSSRVGNILLWKLAAGGVQPYITDQMVKNIPIPIFPESKQQEIHNLIVESANLRVEANRLLEEATEYFDELLKDEDAANSGIISIRNMRNRFDSYSVLENSTIDTIIEKYPIEWIPIKSISEKIFIGPRSKRNYVAKGIPFLSGSELQKSNPTKVEKFLNIKDATPFIVNKDWILITRSGTIGNVSYTLPILDGYGATDDAIRVVVKSESTLTSKYLFAFLASKFGKKCIQKDIFGSVIQHINEDQLGNILIPILDVDKIEKQIEKYCLFLNKAIIKENQAISLVEKEIESWQQS
ncbi:MAG: restriction endonuclease subunit S [Dysgonomonas sp.]